MKRFSTLLLLGLLARCSLFAATTPLYINDGPVRFPIFPPQIDATAFVNESIFQVDLTGPFGVGDLPYQVLNNRYFTNQGSGDMLSIPGFRFDFLTSSVRGPMDTWINRGSIEASSLFGGGSWLLVNATNITNRGSLRVDPSGVLQLKGQNVSISFSELSARTPPATSAAALNAILWGTGTNGAFGSGTSAPVRLDQPLIPLFPRTPQFQVTDGFFLYSGSIGFGSNYANFVWTNALNANTTVFHIAFVQTNAFETNLTIKPTLNTNRGPQQLAGSATIKVDFSFPDYNPITDLTTTNGVSVIDSIAFASPLQLLFPTNFSPNRPNALDIVRLTPTPTNTPPTNGSYSSALIYNSDYLTNRVLMPYAAYNVNIPGAGGGGFFGSDPTNLPGRVEVLSDNINLDQALVEAETTIIIKSKNVSSNKVARTFAPFMNLDLASTQPTFTVSKLISSQISRLSGDVFAWSGFWTNESSAGGQTNTLIFHVLVVEQTLQTTLPVVTSQLALTATNLVIDDLVNFGTYAPTSPAYSNYYDAFFSFVGGTRMFINSRDLTINNGLSLPPGWGWGASNVVGVVNFTNKGLVFVPNGAAFGTDRSEPYSNIVNHGTILAGSQSARVTRLENSGALGTDEGPITLDAVDAILGGSPVTSFNYATNSRPGFPPPRPFFGAATVGSELRAGGNLSIRAGNLALSNAVLLSGATYVTNLFPSANNGVCSLIVTNSLTDAGIASPSYIWNHGGVEVTQRPANSDLLGTTLVVASDRFEEIFNVWAGEDRGPTASGYANNLALSRLACNFDRNSLVYFLPVTLTNGFYATNAMYVDYLELLNSATNLSSFAISENFTIYFANANLDPAAIEAASGGRMRWVSTFAGPLSSADYTAANGKVSKVNRALLYSASVDSDGDGIVNANDTTPFYTADDAVLSVSLTSETPLCARLSWRALAQAVNTVEYTTSPGSGQWQVLTNFVQGAVSAPVTVLDPLSPTGALRVYRLRVTPGTH